MTYTYDDFNSYWLMNLFSYTIFVYRANIMKNKLLSILCEYVCKKIYINKINQPPVLIF